MLASKPKEHTQTHTHTHTDWSSDRQKFYSQVLAHAHSVVKKQAMKIQQPNASTWDTHSEVKRQAGDQQPRVNMREAKKIDTQKDTHTPTHPHTHTQIKKGAMKRDMGNWSFE